MQAEEHERFLVRAIELAEENVRSGRGGPFAALVVRDGRILAEGTNLVTSTNDPTAHAEIVAIRRACQLLHHFQLTGCVLYSSCEPCPMCTGAIYWARPAAVYYAASAEDAAAAGFDDRLIRDELLLAPPQRRIPMVQMLRERALDAFRLWQQSPAKVPY
jgi:guanine deaminase